MNEKDPALPRLLPRSLQKRFDGLGSYVTSILEEAGLDGLSPDQRQLLQLIVFVRALDDLLLDGHRAATSAVATFKELGVERFSIGSDQFYEGSEAVLRGKNLSEGLRSSISDPHLIRIIDRSTSLRQLTLECADAMLGSVAND
jgi:hypothetical protein